MNARPDPVVHRGYREILIRALYTGRLMGDPVVSEQRFIGRPSLEGIFKKTALTERGKRNRAIVEAAVRHGYSQAAIATHYGLHYSSVSKVIKQH